MLIINDEYQQSNLLNDNQDSRLNAFSIWNTWRYIKSNTSWYHVYLSNCSHNIFYTLQRFYSSCKIIMLSIEIESMKIDVGSMATRYHNHWGYIGPRYLWAAITVTRLTSRGSGGGDCTPADVRLQGGESSSITVSTMWIYLATLETLINMQASCF